MEAVANVPVGATLPGYTRRAWTTVAMLFSVQIINRADKAVLGLAAAAIMTELGLTAEEYGLIASSFYFLYAAAGLFVGYFFAHRFRPRIILAVMIAVWSLSQLPIVFAASFGTLLVGRILLGAGEGNGTPTCINACHEWFPAEKRNMPTAIVMAGAVVGSLLSAPALSTIIQHYGWHAAFAACAMAGLAMLVFWLLFSRDGPYSGIIEHKPDTHEKPVSGLKVLSLLKDRAIAGSFILQFCSDWAVGFMVAWYAPFAIMELGFSLIETGWLLSLVFASHVVIMMGGAALSQAMIKRGISTRISRAMLNGAFVIGAAVCFVLATLVTDPYARLVLVGLAVGFPIITFTINPALLSEVFPAQHRNRLLHVMMSAGTIAPMIVPWLAGKLIGDGGHAAWNVVLWINAGVLTVGGIAAFILIDPVKAAERMRAKEV